MTKQTPRIVRGDASERASGLMEARAIGRYLEAIGCRAFIALERRLQALQEQIYYLDALGEGTAHPSPADLRDRWRAIIATMQERLHIGSHDALALTRELRDYQQLELDRRRRLSPWRLSLTQHYHLKTCDVRMQRRLCCLLSGRMPDVLTGRQWAMFDVLSELLDDVEDRTEDWGTFNYNRFEDELATEGSRGIERYLVCSRRLEDCFFQLGGTGAIVSLVERTIAALQSKCHVLIFRRVA